MPATKSKLKLTDLIRTLPRYDPYRDASGYWFDEERAERYIEFIETYCTHIEGDLCGEPYILEPHERAIVANIFGWYSEEDDLRRYRKVLLYYPRKNSKSTFAACVLVAILFVDTEPRMQMFSTGAEVDQAKIIHGIVRAMIEANEELRERVRIFKAHPTIELIADKSVYRALSGKKTGKHGKNTYVLAADELHEYPNDVLLNAIESSMGTRSQPLSIYTTTADFGRISICNQIYDEAKLYRDGIVVNPEFLPVIYEVTREELDADPDCWKKEATWAKVNPLYNKSVKASFLRSELKKVDVRPSAQNEFMRLYCNIQTESDIRWLSMNDWDKCGRELPDLSGRECYCGLDLSSVLDLSALAMAFPRQEVNGGYDVLCKFWCPEESARDRETRDNVPYTQWIRDGYMTATPGSRVDYDIIRRDINELNRKYNIREIAIDRWNSTQLQTQLMGDGFSIWEFGQGYGSMTAPSKELEALIVEGKLAHDKNPVLKFCASNVMIETNAAGDIKPSKDKSTEKIDGIVAIVMAIGRGMLRDVSGSIYETQDVRVF